MGKSNSYKLICSSTVDIPEKQLIDRDIDYVNFHFDMDGEQYDDDFGKSIPIDEFYQKISKGAMPTTSQPNVQQNISCMEPYLEKGMDIVYITLSSGISGAYSSASIAAEMMSEKYPERKIKIIDSLGASSGYGLLVDSAADLRDSGLGFDDLVEWIEENKLNVQSWFFSTDLQHYKRGGRISATSALVGTVLGVCPLLRIGNKGELIPTKKVKGKKKVIKEIVKMMENTAEDGTEYSKKCYISHSACYEDAKKVAELVTEKFPNLSEEVLINDIGTVIGSHTGPGTVALFFYGKKRID